MLRVDAAEDIRQERVARAGFNGSGVSRNNRVIERHESGSVVYWRSYDFAGNTGNRNLFARPLGPGDDPGAFHPDGGEIIFNLPNGLQAYMLVKGDGGRLDKGPTAIAQKGEHDAAIADFTAALRADPRLAVAYYNRGAARFRKGDLDAAIDDYTEALRLDPRSALAFNNRGLAFFEKNDYDRAIADYSAAIRLDPRFARAYFNRGLAYQEKGDTRRAEEDRRRAVQLDPSLEKK